MIRYFRQKSYGHENAERWCKLLLFCASGICLTGKGLLNSYSRAAIRTVEDWERLKDNAHDFERKINFFLTRTVIERIVQNIYSGMHTRL
jgi:hypothetical protein